MLIEKAGQEEPAFLCRLSNHDRWTTCLGRLTTRAQISLKHFGGRLELDGGDPRDAAVRRLNRERSVGVVAVLVEAESRRRSGGGLKRRSPKDRASMADLCGRERRSGPWKKRRPCWSASRVLSETSVCIIISSNSERTHSWGCLTVAREMVIVDVWSELAQSQRRTSAQAPSSADNTRRKCDPEQDH